MPDQFAEGSRVEVVANDPWEFVDADGSNVFQARVVSSTPHEDFQRLLLLRFDRRVATQDGQSETFVAAIKPQSRPSDKVDCWLIATEPAEVERDSLGEILTRWRGGLSARATVREAGDASGA